MGVWRWLVVITKVGEVGGARLWRSVVSQVRKDHSDYGKNKKQNKTKRIRGKQDGKWEGPSRGVLGDAQWKHDGSIA